MNVDLYASRSFGRHAIVAISLLSSTAAALCPVAAQTPADAGAWEVPRTAYGHPDLQGNWTNATLTPFVRPAGWEAVLAWEEVTEIEEGQAEIVARSATPSDPNRPPPIRVGRARSARR